MPKPNPGESRNEYVSRCIKVVMGEGADQEAAVGKCEGMWNSYAGKGIQGEVFNVAVGASIDNDPREIEADDDDLDHLNKDLSAPQVDPADLNVAWPASPEEKIQARRSLGENGAEMLRLPEEDIMVGKDDEGEWVEETLGGEEKMEKDMGDECSEEEKNVEKADRDFDPEEHQTTHLEGGPLSQSEHGKDPDLPLGNHPIEKTAVMLDRTLTVLKGGTGPGQGKGGEEEWERDPSSGGWKLSPEGLNRRGLPQVKNRKPLRDQVREGQQRDQAGKFAAIDEFNEDTVGDQIAHLGPVAGEIRKVVCRGGPGSGPRPAGGESTALAQARAPGSDPGRSSSGIPKKKPKKTSADDWYMERARQRAKDEENRRA